MKILISTIGLLLVFCPQIQASSLLNSSLTNHLSSSPHLVFHQQMAEGSQLGRGSGFMIDLSKKNEKSLNFGLRTMAVGGISGASQNYRLSAGPLLSFNQLFPNFSLQLALLYFKETQKIEDSTPSHNKKGGAFFIGWERYTQLFSGLEMGVGGYFTLDLGKSKIQESDASVAAMMVESTSKTLWARGVEVFFRFKM